MAAIRRSEAANRLGVEKGDRALGPPKQVRFGAIAAEELPGCLPLYSNAATEIIAFASHVASRPL